MAGAARDILIAWSAAMIDRASGLACRQFLGASTVPTSTLSYIVPREHVLSAILRSLYKSVIEPAMHSLDIIAVQFDG